MAVRDHRPAPSAFRPGVHCIMPPYILKQIAENGTASQKSWALATLTASERWRGRREAIGFLRLATSTGEKRRTIYDVHHQERLEGTRVRGEGDPKTGDAAVDQAYDGLGYTYDFYLKLLDRNSIDNRGMRLDAFVHYGVDYDNAFWNGSQMVFGDGDGKIFNSFTSCIDVIAHELTHGVTQYEAGFDYNSQSGALSESMSDVLGILVKQWKHKQPAQKADWLIGKGIFAKGIKGKAIRSMKAPGTAYDDPLLGKDPQPADMTGYVKTREDDGGVHINSGIPNRAFYLAAVSLGRYAWEKAGPIWYDALCNRLRSKSNFKDAARATIASARALFGASVEKKVQAAWREVKVIT